MDKASYSQYVEILEREWRKIEKAIREYEKIVIYGAGKVGKKVCCFLKGKGYEPSYFVVSNPKYNEKFIHGVEVVSLDNLYEKKGYLYIVAVLDLSEKKDIKSFLAKWECEHVIEFNPDIINCLEDFDTKVYRNE